MISKLKFFFGPPDFRAVISLLIFGFMPNLSGPCRLIIQVIIAQSVSELRIDSQQTIINNHQLIIKPGWRNRQTR